MMPPMRRPGERITRSMYSSRLVACNNDETALIEEPDQSNFSWIKRSRYVHNQVTRAPAARLTTRMVAMALDGKQGK